MSRFELTYPAVITVVRDGVATRHLAPWSGGALLQDLLGGAARFLAHVDALPAAPSFVLAIAEATIDVDRRHLQIDRDAVDLERAPALRRAYQRALARTWPEWGLVERGRRADDQAPLTLLRALPEGRSGLAWITHVRADGSIVDVDVGVRVDEALSLGPPLRAALAGRAVVELTREASIVDGVIAAPCRSGALVDDRRRRVEVWWSAPSPASRATLGPLARLWPGYTLVAQEEGLPRQIAGSGRDPGIAVLADADADALLDHLLYVERWVDPSALQTQAQGALEELQAAGVPIEIPAAIRAAARPSGATPVPTPPRDRPLFADAPELLRLARAIDEIDDALARDDDPGAAQRVLLGPPAWVMIVDVTVDRALAAAARVRLRRWLAPLLKIDLAGIDDDRLAAHLRAALVDRARRARPS